MQPAKRSRVELVAPPEEQKTAPGMQQLLSIDLRVAVSFLGPCLDPFEMFSLRRVSKRFREILSTPSIADTHWRRMRMPRSVCNDVRLVRVARTTLTGFVAGSHVAGNLTSLFPSWADLERDESGNIHSGCPLDDPPRGREFWSLPVRQPGPDQRPPTQVGALAETLRERGEKSAAYISLARPWRCVSCKGVFLEIGTGHVDEAKMLAEFHGGNVCAACEIKSPAITIDWFFTTRRMNFVDAGDYTILRGLLRDLLFDRVRDPDSSVRCVRGYYSYKDVEQAMRDIQKEHPRFASVGRFDWIK